MLSKIHSYRLLFRRFCAHWVFRTIMIITYWTVTTDRNPNDDSWASKLIFGDVFEASQINTYRQIKKQACNAARKYIKGEVCSPFKKLQAEQRVMRNNNFSIKLPKILDSRNYLYILYIDSILHKHSTLDKSKEA